jgi:hypothetical protein
MRKVRFILTATATFCATFFLLTLSVQGETAQENSSAIFYFDVLELPARIDEPKLVKLANGYSLKCAIANRSDEPLLGLRVILMIVGHEGKLRTRMTWSEESPVSSSSIGLFEFPVSIKQKVLTTDKLFLAVDEVIGRETIWRALDAEKALRAYSRGQHDIVPKVKAVANKDDRQKGPIVIPLRLRKP